jgi:hypothetical protein
LPQTIDVRTALDHAVQHSEALLAAALSSGRFCYKGVVPELALPCFGGGAEWL